MLRTPTIATTLLALLALSGTSAADDQPMIDADVHAGARGGAVRILVELRASQSEPSAIETAQNEVLRRLAGTGARLARRYSTVPLLALEIDARALARLDEMRDLVARVRVDRISSPHDGSPRAR
jgi:hypothetical protein